MKNMRSASPRWAIDTMEPFGLPLASYNNVAVSSGSPCIHVWKPGAANRLFSFIASSVRSFGGKTVSSGITPTVWNGGD